MMMSMGKLYSCGLWLMGALMLLCSERGSDAHLTVDCLLYIVNLALLMCLKNNHRQRMC
jgi:hypothetical protein